MMQLWHLKNGLVLKIVEVLQEYLSCKIEFSAGKKRALLGQPHLIKNLDKKFGEHVKSVYSHTTTGMSKFLIVRPTEENKKISTEKQKEYWSNVGILLYLIQH